METFSDVEDPLERASKEEALKWAAANMHLAGLETTHQTVLSLMAAMALHPAVQARARKLGFAVEQLEGYLQQSDDNLPSMPTTVLHHVRCSFTPASNSVGSTDDVTLLLLKTSSDAVHSGAPVPLVNQNLPREHTASASTTVRQYDH